MNILLKSAKIIAPNSEYHQQIKDILIKDGIISKIDNSIATDKDTKVISYDNLHVSEGWFDSSVSLGEPGHEERETIENGLKTAGLSGFTGIAVNPNAYPIADTNADIGFLKAKASGNATNLYPIGALTIKSESVDLAELFDMKNAGAVAFGDYQQPISNPNLLKIALQYTQNFDGLVLSFPQENKIAGKGIVNEEANGTKLGLKGIPALAEELQIARDLFILEYSGGKLHIPTISTAKSVSLIKDAKAKGLDVTCSVAIHNLILTDDALIEFDTNYKVLPPLRTQKDTEVLIKALKEGIIDFVTSDHNPLDTELKKVEFDHAAYGTIGLESAFGALQTVVSTEKAIELLTSGKLRFGIPSEKIKVGSNANLTLFNPDETYTFENNHILSTSKNSAFLGENLKGKVYGILANNQLLVK
ncbi:dihydroorotase-like cyclic amidohydrolase [Galbibacter orientalis DSM 19592]|uniref:Dihydroorotase-like cyclic amidohydrolase n=1 Tax=Galbibacter orientalis DSM 19592 TaxID=926559 RepID=I3C9W6_9FLAO|nr:dihydroorotase [Galbibacter orientalis]EIJ40409.1 dihydroorotase-like cyclic amidohydrolase [Galbibacter orientalis DSM 19592]